MKLLATLLFPIALAASPVSADPIQAESLAVSIADLDLASAAGQKAFDRRLGRAVVDLCGEAADVDLAGRNAVRKCRADTLAQAYRAKDQRLALRSADPIQLAAR
ncbi:MAG: UrcA family protein [Sphingomicrobium sp.]